MTVTAGNDGLTLVEVLMALAIVLIVSLMICQIVLRGSEVNANTQARMSALKFAEMEKEEIAKTPLM